MPALNVKIATGYVTTGTTPETVYTSPAAGQGTRITALTAYNKSVTTESYTAYIAPDATAATSSEAVVNQAVTTLKSDVPLEALNQIIPPGGTLQVDTSAAGAFTFQVSGIEFT